MRGSITTLSNTDAGGTWTSASSVATVSTAGDVTGVAAGTVRITYTLGTGCLRTRVITVNALPTAITGSGNVCPGTTSLLNNDIVGGTWSSSDMTTASIDATTGALTGNAAGNATITYTLPTGCVRTRSITVNDAVAPITGTTDVCAGLTTTLATTSAGGLYMSGNTSVVTIDAVTGVATGVAAGNAMVSYTMPAGCMATTMITVRALPAAISGSTQVCAGSSAMLSNTTTGGTWTSGNASVATIGSSTGMVMGVAAGNTAITYTLSTGCSRTTVINVNPLPFIDTVTGGGSYCAGGTGVHLGLHGSQTATSYSLYNGASLIATTSGSGLALDFGLQTAAGAYSVTAISAAGCAANMNGSRTVTITPLSVPSVAISSTTSDSVCQGTAVTYTADVTNGGLTPVYVWKVNGTVLGSAGTFSFTPANGDNITAEVTSSAACPSVPVVMATRHMSVTPNQTPAVNIAATSATTVCQGSAVTFIATPVSGGTAPVYTWIAGGTTATATGATFTYTPANGDVVMAKLLSNYACPVTNNVSSNTVAITVNNIYVPVVSINATPGLVVNKGQSVTFNTTVTNAGPTPAYQWMVNGTPVGGAVAATYTTNQLNDGDSVTVMVTGSGACGYPTINSVSMRVITASTGIAQAAAGNTSITLSPNPNSGSFIINGTLGTTANQDVNIQVTDLLGQVVYTAKATAQAGAISERIQLSNNLANGMYILNLSTGSEHATTHFVVKQ